MDSTGRADMDMGTVGSVRDNEDGDGGQEGDSSGDLMGLQGGKEHCNGQCYNYGQWGHTAKKLRVKSNREKENTREITKDRGTKRRGNGWWWNQKG